MIALFAENHARPLESERTVAFWRGIVGERAAVGAARALPADGIFPCESSDTTCARHGRAWSRAPALAASWSC